MSPHDDVQREQRHIDFAYECLAVMRARTGALLERDLAATEVDSEIVKEALHRRFDSMAEGNSPLCFGRIDEELGDTHYIGRRHVKDDDNRPVVIDWRAHIAAPFYRATIRDSLGLERRRRFMFDGRKLLDIYEEDFADPDSVAAGHGGVPDPLLAELGRARTGEMRDIVATIQAEQDEIIRFPVDHVVIVQGGPGTGKTAVGLHRAAFLLYEHRERLEREGVLVVGPNRTFLEYISAVLPSLGETAVRQATVEELFGARYRVTRDDPPDLAVLKGDIRMAELVRRACRAQILHPETEVRIDTARGSVRVDARAVSEVLEKSLAGARDLKSARTLFVQRFERVVQEFAARRFTDKPASVIESIGENADFKRARDKMWPSINPATTVARLLAGGKLLRDCAHGLLSPDEVSLLASAGRRAGDRRWSRQDLPLLDEAEALVSGSSNVCGHVIVDEAQDLSDAELRMLGRRSSDGSLTVLGDLAQATRPGSQTNWDDVVAHIGAPAPVRRFELDIGYRVPKPITDFANLLLPVAAPHVPPPLAIRAEGAPPRLVRSEAGALPGHVWDEAARLAARWPTVGVVVPEPLFDAVVEFFSDRDPARSRWDTDELVEGIALLHPELAKGLEFDAVLVAEPAAISERGLHGARMLYVALTRAVQELTLVYSRALPAELAA